MSGGLNKILSGEVAQTKSKGKAYLSDLWAKFNPTALLKREKEILKTEKICQK